MADFADGLTDERAGRLGARGFTHLQFEAALTGARESPHPCDFALVAIVGLLDLRIFEATGAGIADLGEEHGHRVLRVCGKGTKIGSAHTWAPAALGITGGSATVQGEGLGWIAGAEGAHGPGVAGGAGRHA